MASPTPTTTPTATSPARTVEVASPDIFTAVEQYFPGIPTCDAGAESTVAFAFDMDGVLVRDRTAVPGARETLQKLQDSHIPFLILTNGGGMTEVDHANRLAGQLDVAVDLEQFVQSHSPFHALVPWYRDKTILALGGVRDNIRNVAEAYGFRKVMISSDLMAEWEHIHPFPEMTKQHHGAHGRRTGDLLEREISVVLVWSSPRDWCLDLQVLYDLLLSSGGIVGRKSPKAGDTTLPNRGYLQDGQPKLYFCIGDLEWPMLYSQPRFAQGAFREALRGIWTYATDGEAELGHSTIGKPKETNFSYGERILHAYNEKPARDRGRPVPAIRTVYKVGDNPKSDVAGANDYMSRLSGTVWRSILVETGIYEAGSTPTHHRTI